MAKIEVAHFKSVLRNYGIQAGFSEVYDAHLKDVENCSYRRLDHFGYCISPATHKEDVAQETFSKFLGISEKVYTGEYEIESVWGVLSKISKRCSYDHFYRGHCYDFSQQSTVIVDDVEYTLEDKRSETNIEKILILKEAFNSLPIEYYNSVEYLLKNDLAEISIEKILILKEALGSLSIEYYDALADFIAGFSHKQISINRHITEVCSRRRRAEAVHKLIRYYEIKKSNLL